MIYQKTVKRLIGIIICIVSIYFPAFAQETSPASNSIINKTEKENPETVGKDADEDKSVKLNTIVVTATRTKERLKDVPVHVDVITSKDIEASGLNTLGDVVGQKMTGHYQRYSGLSQPAGLTGNLATDSMGDHTSDRVIVLIDGHKLGTGNLAKVPPEIIERVEIMKAPGSALYGSAAMGGVINIITKKGKGEVQNTAKLETGSFDYSRAAITSGGNTNDFASYFISASLMRIGDYKTKNYGTAYNSKEEQAHLWGNMCLYPSDDQSLRIGFSYADLISYYPEWNNYNKNTYYDNNINQYSDVGRGHIDLEYNLSMIQNRINWKAIFYELRDKRSWYYGTSGKPEDDASIYTDYTTGTDQQLEITLLPYNKILTGYTFELLKRNAKTKEAGITVANTTPDFNYYTNSVYVQDTLSILNNNLIITGGARYDKFNLDTDNSGAYAKDVSYDNLSPRAGIVYKIMDLLRIRGNAGRAFRAPNANELTMDHPTSYGSFRGNPDLKPEISSTFDAGLDIYPEFITLGATYSYVKLKDAITYNYIAVDNLYKYENVNDAKMEIIDCYFDLSINKLFVLPFELNISTNITFNRTYEDTNTGDKLPFVADREAKSNIQTIYRKLRLTLSHVYVGHEILKNSDKKCSFNFFNLTSGYEISSNISAEIGILNLINTDYEWIEGYPSPERNYKIALTGKF
jgi:vitamin B12 transporter